MPVAGARRLPMQHLSIRAPWQDVPWDGRICSDPKANAACLRLRAIRERRDDKQEQSNAGRTWDELDTKELPACRRERANFMAPFDLTVPVTHPYMDFSPAHKHLASTNLVMPAYSAGAVPFRWMLKSEVPKIATDLEIGFQEELETRADDLIGWPSAWLQDRRNQLVMEDTFFSAIRPDESLCFFYAKQTPLAEDHRRVLLGIGLVRSVGEQTEYEVVEPGDLRSMLWERAVRHSIRPHMKEGFLFPYHALYERMQTDESFRPEPYVAFVPDEHFDQFSFTAEHVPHDAALSMLLTGLRTLEATSEGFGGDYSSAIGWINEQLGRLWRLRGPFPGVGAALTAFGIQRGHLVAHALAEHVGENENPWPVIQEMFKDPRRFEVDNLVGTTLKTKWLGLPDERRALLELLARFDITAEQATRLFVKEERERAGISIDDADLLVDPYVLYELDRRMENPLSVGTIDRGVFPDPVVRTAHPIPAPSDVSDNLDGRRVRALLVSLLEGAADNGDTLKPESALVRDIRDMAIQPTCPVDSDTMNVLRDGFKPVLRVAQMADGSPAYQLERLGDMGDLIRNMVLKRVRGRRHVVEADWRALLDDRLPSMDRADEAEERARHEKAAALKELAEARISVLIGSAGTGKTTLLSVLCAHPAIKKGGIRLLAPTGKARVQIEQRTGEPAKTVAQFLLRLDRYDHKTDVYRRSKREKVADARTLVIDEASMLTEDQLGAVLDSIKDVDRIILVGDPRQLPPIGAGRPFVDVIAQVTPDDVEASFPRVAPCYAELTVPRRHVQGGERRDLADLTLASWFSGRDPGAGADEVWETIGNENWSDTLRFIRWEDTAELHEKLLEVLVDELDLDGLDDGDGFERSIGGTEYGNYIYFRHKQEGSEGAGAGAERWQVLSPLRGQAPGSTDLNRVIQRHFRADTLSRAHSTRFGPKIPKPVAPEEIVYGDKVINVRNRNRKWVWPEENALKYVANGEIGIVTGQFKARGSGMKGRPKHLEVEFSSQLGHKYKFFRGEFGDEGTPPLELAYAITVHKSQGSEFKKTILVVPNPCRLLSRELLYTALTRQQERVVVLHQGDFSHLRRFATPAFSETAKRTTNLFRKPELVKVKAEDELFLEEHLIHRTRRGDLVRSKSEVIIADLLYSKGIADYEYEGRLADAAGNVRYPDFVIEDQDSGQSFYWEHLGMLEVPEYRARWEKKLEWYHAQEIREIQDGGGRNGTLIITRDDERGAVDSSYFESMVDKLLAVV